ncbi:MAG: hypothetical protein K8L91_06090 [Anaerolineae bacterium]|nr:hypothetical protein [Anaerolineae bacterium]
MKRLTRLFLTLSIAFAAVFAVGLSAPHSAEAAYVSYTGSLTFTEDGDTTNAWDAYALTVKAGQSFEIGMICLEEEFDPYLEIYDSLGNLLLVNDDGYPTSPEDVCDYSSLLSLTALVDGNFIVHATSYWAFYPPLPNGGWGTGGYKIYIDGDFVAFGPVANNVPNYGEVKLDTGQHQPAYVNPGGGEIIRGSNGADVWLPADADGSGYDTYVVTDAVEMDGEVWIAVWLGGENYGWLPLSGVTPTRQLAIN